MTPLLMKTLVISGLIFNSITDGYIFGQMSGMIDSMMRPESHLKFTENEVSWIASTLFVSTIIGALALGLITDMIGRKRAATVLTTPILLSWIMLYYAQNIAVFIINRVIVGVFFGGAFITTAISAGEYTSPKSRSTFITIIMSISPALGTGIGHVLSLVMDWRYVALFGIVPTVIAMTLPLFWVESPAWLASKGRYDECEQAFRALHGTDNESEKELALLLKLEKSKQSGIKIKRTKFSDALTQKRFFRVSVLSFTVSLYNAASGRSLFPLYAITIIKEITNSSDVVIYTVLLEVLTVFGTVLSIFFTKICKIRPLMIIGGLLSGVVLSTLSASLFMQPDNSSNIMAWVNVSLLSIYLVLTSAGPFAVIFAIIGEIFPLDLKAYCVPINVCTSCFFAFFSVKTATMMFSKLGYHGVFLLYVAVSLLCLFIFWLKLPETKGRTLQEIELFFENNAFQNIDDLLLDQNKPLKT